MRNAIWGAALLLLSLGGNSFADEQTRGSPGAWAERVQILYREGTRSVERRTVRVWDGNPQRNLDFVWEPARGEPTGGLAADGVVSGKGRLVWRVKGSASYDPRTIFSVYEGTLLDGRPEGEGRLEIRSGEVFEGHWVAGRLHGAGTHIDAAGNRYEGAFADGLPNGPGRLLERTGRIYVGSFANGLRHGRGRTTLAGGTSYESDWSMGIELGGARPDALADAGVGGLLRAQSGGGDAGKVEFSTVVDQRMTQQADMRYQHLVRDGDVAIYPVEQELNDAWNGTGKITGADYLFRNVDWEGAAAFVEVGMATTDGSRVKVDKLELQVANSEAYRKPMLTLESHLGCVGFRPDFTLLNHGWGGVRDATINLQFTGEDEGGPGSRLFSRRVGDFSDGTDVDIRDVFEEAGVDTARLDSGRFSCPSADSLNVCRSQVMNTVGFGEVADFVWGEDKLFTTVAGSFDYTWQDDAGASYQVSEPFRVNIALATIVLPKELAECGDGFGGSPEALRYQEVKLPVGQRDYVVDLPMRGNRNIRDYTARLKMSAEMSSFHQFQAVARFADGSERRSKPVSLFYFRPNPSMYRSQVQLPACYLDESVGGC